MKSYVFFNAITGTLLLALVFMMTSCNKSIKGEGDLEIRTISLPPFSAINNSISGNINVTRSEQQRVEIQAQPNIINNITLTVSNGVWDIGFIKNVRKHLPVTINIYIPELSGLKISGSGDIQTIGGFDSCGIVNLEISGSGNINAMLNAQTAVKTIISGSGGVVLTGNSPYQDITISGSGDVRAFGMASEDVRVNISGSGSCEVSASRSLIVSISGSGNVYYRGYPAVTLNSSGSGSVINSN